MTKTAHAVCALACLALALALAGCSAGPGHVRDRLSVGLSLFSVPLISVLEVRHEAMSDAAAASGDRLGAESGPSPFSFLGLGRGVHAIQVGPSDAQAEAMQRALSSTPSSAAPAAPTPTESAPPRDPPRSESRDTDAPNGPGDGAGAAHRTDRRGRR